MATQGSTDLSMSALDRFGHSLRTGLFGLAYTVVKEMDVEKRIAIVAMTVEFLQMLGFPISASHSMPWADSPTIYPFARAIEYITTDRIDHTHSTETFRAVLSISAIWSGILLLLSWVVAYSFAKALPQNVLILRALRSMTQFSTTYLFLPFTGVLFRALACPAGYSGWMDTGWDCSGPERATIAVIMVLLLVGLSALSLFVVATVIDRNPASESWAARSQGRVDVAMLAIKLVLGFFYNVVDEALLGSWFLTVFLLLVGCAWMGLYLRFMPLTNPWVNSYAVGLGAGFTWASLALALAQLAPDEGMTFFLYIGIPFAVVLGTCAARLRENSLVQSSLNSLHTVYSLDRWARHRIRAFVAAVSNGRIGSSALKLRQHLIRAREEASAAAAAATAHAQLHGGAAGSAAAVAARGAGAHGATSTTRADVTLPPGDAERHGPVDMQSFESLLDEARTAYKLMQEEFATEEMAQVLSSVFFREYSTLHYLELLALSRARRENPALDLQYYIYQRTRQLREADDSGLSPIDRVLFDQQLQEVRTLRIDAFRQLVMLWEGLAEHTPDLQDVLDRGVSLQDILGRIDRLFGSLLRLNPDSAAVLRTYATHLLDFANESNKAMELLNKADRVEEVHSKQRSRVMRHIIMGTILPNSDTLDERSAVITVSGDTSNMGEILGVSAAACRIFGYTAAQIVGQNIDILVPPPIRAVHGNLMFRFSERGESTVVGRTRLLFGHHRSGAIFPQWMQFIEAPPDDETSAPRFTAIMSPITTDEHHIFFGDASTGFRLYAASARSLALLGVDAVAVAEDNISLSEWFPTLLQPPSERSKLSRAQAERLKHIPSTASLFEALMRGMALTEPLPTARESVRESSAGAGSTMTRRRTFRLTRTPTGTTTSSTTADLHEGRRDFRTAETVEFEPVPLLKATTTTIIPVENTTDGAEYVLGSVQELRIWTMPVWYMLRWRPFPTSDYAPTRHTVQELSDGGSSGGGESDEAVGSDRATDEESSEGAYGGENEDEHADAFRDDDLHPVSSPGARRTRARPLVVGESAVLSDNGSEADGGRGGGADGTAGAAVAGPAGFATSPDRSASGAGPGADGATPAEGSADLPGSLPDTSGSVIPEMSPKSSNSASMKPLLANASVDQTLSLNLPMAVTLTPMGAGNGAGGGGGGGGGAQGAWARGSRQLPPIAPSNSRTGGTPVRGGGGGGGGGFGGPGMTGGSSAHGVGSGTFPLAVRGRPYDSGDAMGSGVRMHPILEQSSHGSRVPTTEMVAYGSAGATGSGMGAGRRGSATMGDRVHSSAAAAAAGAGAAGTAGATHTNASGHPNAMGMQPHPSLTRANGTRMSGVGSGLFGGGGASSVGSSTKVGAQLRRAIASQDQIVEPEVRRTTWIMVSIVLVLVVVAAANIIWAEYVAENLTTVAKGLWMSGDRLTALQATEWYFHGILVINTSFAFYGPTDSLLPGLSTETKRMRAAHEYIYMNAHKLGDEAYDYELNTLHPVVEVSETGAVRGEYQMPMAELGEYYASKVERLMQFPVNDIRSTMPEARNVVRNRQVVQDAMNMTIKLREKAYVALEPEFEQQLIIAGSAFFLITVIVSSIFFVTAVRSLGQRTESVLRAFLYVPGRVAKAMQKRSVALLNRLVATAAEGEEDDGEQDEEAEMRLIIQEDDVDTSLDRMVNTLKRSGSRASTLSRPYTNSSRYVSQNMMRLLFPIVLVLGWLIFLVVYQMNVAKKADLDLHRMSLIQSITTLLMEFADTISHIVLGIGTLQDNLVFVQQIDAQLLSAAKLAVFGGTMHHPVGYDIDVTVLEEGTVAQAFLTGNACDGSEDPVACASFADGILLEGIYSGLLAAMNLGRRVVASMLERGALNDTNAIADFAQMLQIEYPHLRHAMYRASVALRDEGVRRLEDGVYVTTIVSIAFVVGFALFTIFGYWPIIARLAGPLRSARSLLGLFPEDLILNIVPLRDAVQDIATEVQLGGQLRAHRRNGVVPAARVEKKGDRVDVTDREPTHDDADHTMPALISGSAALERAKSGRTPGMTYAAAVAGGSGGAD